LVYISFLIAAQHVFSSVEASKTDPGGEAAPAHDTYMRLLQRLPPQMETFSYTGDLMIDRRRGQVC
jgi:hypothetical protein